eukprot:1158074-Pelagomonas_calceolata.AAC.3
MHTYVIQQAGLQEVIDTARPRGYHGYSVASLSQVRHKLRLQRFTGNASTKPSVAAPDCKPEPEVYRIHTEAQQGL